MRVRSNLKHTHTDETTNEHIHTNTATTSASNVRAHFGKQFVSTVRLLIDPSGRQPGRAADCNTFNRDEHLSHVKHLSLHTNTAAPTRPPQLQTSSTLHFTIIDHSYANRARKLCCSCLRKIFPHFRAAASDQHKHTKNHGTGKSSTC